MVQNLHAKWAHLNKVRHDEIGKEMFEEPGTINLKQKKRDKRLAKQHPGCKELGNFLNTTSIK